MKIVIEFHGGFRDGTSLVGDTNIPSSASAYPFLTGNATIGKRVSEMPPDRQIAKHRIFFSEEKSAALKRSADDMISRFKSGELTESEMESEMEELMQHIEIQFPRSPDWMSRAAEFRNVIYEITSRDVRNGCIYATASYIGDDEERVPPQWPPDLGAG